MALVYKGGGVIGLPVSYLKQKTERKQGMN